MSFSQPCFTNVKSVLVVISSKAMLFDPSALRNLISHEYPGAVVFFVSASGKPMGVKGPGHVDLIIDFTEPGARQSLFFARKLRSRGTYVVGRNSGWFVRRKKYDRVYDEVSDRTLPSDYMERERVAQRKVLELAGIPVVKQGGVTPDRSKEIALTLPPMQNR